MRKRLLQITFLLLTACMGLSGGGNDFVPTTLQDVQLSPDALYNGIVIPENWNFAIDPDDSTRKTVPYLIPVSEGGYAPEIVNIDIGRQLFVDDYLIESTTLNRVWYQAQLLNEPVFKAETQWETDNENGAVPGADMTSGGLWYDMDEKIYKMWYEAGFNGTLAYATSQDGIHWERPALNRDGSNLLLRSVTTDSFSIWLDYDAQPSERYKMMIRTPNIPGVGTMPAKIYTSANGTAWRLIGETGMMDDRSTFYQNWFNKLWVFSIRGNVDHNWNGISRRGRVRLYHADSDFVSAAQWSGEMTGDNPATFWLMADDADTVDTTQQGAPPPQLYNFDAIAYESVMVGMFQIWYGPTNEVIQQTGNPKITELQAAFSRDSYYYDRPVRGAGNALIPASRTEGTWDYGYLQSATGGLIVYDDEIRIYYSAFSGDYRNGDDVVSGAYSDGAVGYATLRRDGFASMSGSGELLTKPLTVTKAVKYLFVNTDSSVGSLKAEILDAEGNVLPGFSAEDCVSLTVNSCCQRIEWRNSEDLSFLQGKGFRIRFVADSADLYSFWLSADPNGASGGAVGAGYAGEKELNPDLSDTDDGTAPITDNPDDAIGCVSSSLGPIPASVAVSVFLFKRQRKRNAVIANKPCMQSARHCRNKPRVGK